MKYGKKGKGGHGAHHAKHNKSHGLPADVFAHGKAAYGAGTPMTGNFAQPADCAPEGGGPYGGSTPGSLSENSCCE